MHSTEVVPHQEHVHHRFQVVEFLAEGVRTTPHRASKHKYLLQDGTPEIARYGKIRVGGDAKEQLENDLTLELAGVQHYNTAIESCARVKDNGTREFLEPILAESEAHVDWLETQLRLIARIGLDNYLTEQMG